MPRIASHHANDPWRPLMPWPDDCMVQWGGSGLVLSGEKSYGTAFFEAFPGDGVAGFLRGEGETVERAEAEAFAAFSRQRDCHVAGGHRWTRARRADGHEDRLRHGRKVPKVTTYANGGGFCLGCGAFRTAFEEIHVLGHWRRPLGLHDLQSIMQGYLRPDPRIEARQSGPEVARARRGHRRLLLRARLAGIAVPDHTLPEYRLDPGRSPLVEDAYERACRRAVAEHYIEGRDRFPAPDGDSLDGFFGGLARRQLERAAEEYLASA